MLTSTLGQALTQDSYIGCDVQDREPRVAHSRRRQMAPRTIDQQSMALCQRAHLLVSHTITQTVGLPAQRISMPRFESSER